MVLKMIIADDEPLICTEIAECIDWITCDIEIVGVARNGLDFVHQCQEKRPDLCIVDIGMSQLGGLEAIDIIRQFLPGIKFIIFSGSEDFEHARHAISSGVAGYLLKPLNEELLIQMVKKTAGYILLEQEREKRLDYANHKIVSGQDVIFASFIKKLILNELPEEELSFTLQLLNLHEPRIYFLLLVDHPFIEVKDVSLTVGMERVSALHRTIQKLLKIKTEVLWALLTPRISLGIVKDTANQTFETIQSKHLESAGNQLGIEFHLVSRKINSIVGEFRQAYEELNQALENEMNQSPIIKAVENLIQEDFMNKELCLGQIARRWNISPQYLSRLFKSETGISFSEYLIQTRTRNAIHLIISTNAPIHEISSSVGYASHYYFSNAFKKATGLSPTEYRMCHKRV